MTPLTIDRPTSEGAYFARGIVVSLMVYGHVSFVGSATLAQQNLYEILHSFRMPVLIFLTGYFLNTRRDGADTLRRAVRMVLIPYVVFEVMYLVVHTGMNLSGLMRTNTPPVTSVEDFFRTVLIDPTGPFWFLYYLAVMQIVVALAQIVHRRLPAISMDMLLITAGCALALTRIVTADFVVFYLAGIAFRAREVRLNGSILFALAIVVTTYVAGAGSIEASYLLRAPFVFAMTLLLVALGARYARNWFFRFFALAGRNSISVLCWHAFLIAALRPLAGLFLRIDPTGIVYAVVASLVGVVGALVLTRLSDRLGISRPLFGNQPAYQAPRAEG